VDRLKLFLRIWIVLPFLNLFCKVSPENSINYAERSLLISCQKGLEFCTILYHMLGRLNSYSLRDRNSLRMSRSWLRSIVLYLLFGSWSARSIIASSILIDHQEGSEKIEFILFSYVIVKLLQLHDYCSIVLNSWRIHIVLESPERFLNIDLSVKS